MPETSASRNAPPAAWPADVPSQADAEGILCAALGGLKAADDAALDEALDALTPVERAALDGSDASPGAERLRGAATLRYRVATAIRSAPPPGSNVDGAAVSALLGEIDAALAALSAGAQGAPPEHAASLDAIRKALVKEAIDLSELAQRTAPPEAAPAAAPAPAAKPAAPVARVLSTRAAPDPEDRRPIALWVVLGVAIVVGGGYHGYRAWRVQEVRAAAARAAPFQVPAGFSPIAGPPGGTVMLVPNGEPRDPQALEAFKVEQRARGYEVRELRGGVLAVGPVKAAKESR